MSPDSSAPSGPAPAPAPAPVVEAAHTGTAPAEPQGRRRRKAARPQELLDAALELFVEKGFAATRSEEVAARAGVSKGTLYLYYPSKGELFKAVVRQNLSALIAEGYQLADQFEGNTPDLLRLLLREWWKRVSQPAVGCISKIIIAEVRNFPDLAQFYVDEVIAPAHQLLSRTLQRGIDRGEFRPVPVGPAVVALVAPTMFLTTQRHSLCACPVNLPLQQDDSVVIDTHIEIMLAGLAHAVFQSPGPGCPPVAAGRESP